MPLKSGAEPAIHPEVSARRRKTYAFTDPLGSSDPAGTRRRIRHALALIYGAAAPSLCLAVLTDGGPLSQRLATGTTMAVAAAFALVMLAWRRAPDLVLLAGFPLAALTVSSIAVLDPPLALTPMFYVWPLMIAAYFLQRREIVVTYAMVCASFGAVSVWALDDGPRLMQWATVAIVGGVLVLFVGALSSRLDDLVGRLRTLSREDPLTGALNRRALIERLETELSRAGRTGGSCAVAVLDIDHFKDINDRYGHATGDEALRRVVRAISGRLRRDDALGRLGGEEFAVVLAGADATDAEAYGEELRVRVARAAAAGGTPFTVSVGVAANHRPAEATADGLLAAADAALYRAKRAGRDSVRAA